ncbi:hypothetical protein EHS25_008343 [Saitozyma podzolica]|uniref:Uncharacterized protein n=1 Tax=Saitozyma podzolica TaxID=1890683 RepID=A0A427YPA0_9TREE|nr:hypothetical protein EHS25_008343 [Saitozyma podzolica]
MPHSTDESASASGSNDTTSPPPTTNGTSTPAASASAGSVDETSDEIGDFSLGEPLDDQPNA